MKSKITTYHRLILTLIITIITGLSFTGMDCDKLLTGVPGDVTGTWQLVRMEGTLQDVCLGEILQFQSNGIATLTCPNGTPRQRNYTLESGVLTFTETNVVYNVTTENTNGIEQMVLTGVSISRILTYNAVTTAAADYNSASQVNSNSSESENK